MHPEVQEVAIHVEAARELLTADPAALGLHQLRSLLVTNADAGQAQQEHVVGPGAKLDRASALSDPHLHVTTVLADVEFERRPSHADRLLAPVLGVLHGTGQVDRPPLPAGDDPLAVDEQALPVARLDLPADPGALGHRQLRRIVGGQAQQAPTGSERGPVVGERHQSRGRGIAQDETLVMGSERDPSTLHQRTMLLRRKPLTVDQRPVATAQIVDLPALAVPGQLGVHARDLGPVQAKLAVMGAPNQGPSGQGVHRAGALVLEDRHRRPQGCHRLPPEGSPRAITMCKTRTVISRQGNYTTDGVSTPVPADPIPLRPRMTAPTVTDSDFGPRLEDDGPMLDGRVLGRYRIQRELGRGGMGVVVEAYDPSLDRRIALKLLRNLGRRRSLRQLREAQALARVSHPNVVAVYEVGTIDGQDFIAMELVEGQSLAQWGNEPRAWPEVLDMYIQAGRGLAAVHAEGLVHRDFKPSNCLVDGAGRVRVADFGLAGDEQELSRRSDSDGDPPPPPPETSGPFERLTRPGAVLGTLAYMSPEQRLGTRLDARSDQYSFCMSMFEALLGKDVLQPNSLDVPREPPGSPIRLPRALRRILTRGVARDPEQRWPRMDALVDELERQRQPRRRWRWAAAILGTNIALAAMLWDRTEPSEPPCQHSLERLEGIWDDARASEVRAAFQQTALPYAMDTAVAVHTRLGRYAEAWADMHADTCEAAHVRGELSQAGLDQRMACLERRRRDLDHAVEQLLETDSEAVQRAVAVATGLPSPERCANATALRNGPPPSDEQVELVTGLRNALGRARARLHAGRYESGLQQAEAALAEADLLGYAPVRAEAHLLCGELHVAMGRYEDAMTDLRAARRLALRLDYVEVVTEASTQLTFVLGVPMSQRDGAMLLGESALALAQRIDEGGPSEAEAHLSMAQVLAKHGDDGEAEDQFARALELLRASPDVDPLDVVGALDGLRGVMRRQGQLPEAEDLAREAVARVERDLGPEHPAMVLRLANLATVLVDQGRHAAAEHALRRALALGANRPDHPATAHAHGNLGAVLLYLGRDDEAAEQLGHALEIWKRVHSPEHDRVADVRVNLGVVSRRRGRLDEAEEHYRDARDRYVEAYGPHHPKVARVDLNLGRVLREQGHPDRAAQRFEAARRAAEDYGGPEHVDVGKALEALGLLDFREQRYDSAKEHQQRALALFERAFPTDPPPPRVARARWALGRTELKLGRIESARAHLERARTMLVRSGTRPRDLARTELTLAKLEWDDGRGAAQSQRLARQALARLVDRTDEPSRALRDELSAWLDAHP